MGWPLSPAVPPTSGPVAVHKVQRALGLALGEIITRSQEAQQISALEKIQGKTSLERSYQ